MITCAHFYQQSREVGLEARFLLTFNKGIQGAVPSALIDARLAVVPSPFLTLGFQLEESMTKEGCVVGSSNLSVLAIMLVAL